MTYSLGVKACPGPRTGDGKHGERMPLHRTDRGAVDLDVCSRLEIVSSGNVDSSSNISNVGIVQQKGVEGTGDGVGGQ